MSLEDVDDLHDRSQWRHAQWVAFQEGWHTGKVPDREGVAQIEGNLNTRERVAYDDGESDAKAQQAPA